MYINKHSDSVTCVKKVFEFLIVMGVKEFKQ